MPNFWVIFILIVLYLKLLSNIFYSSSIAIVFRTVFLVICFGTFYSLGFFYPKNSGTSSSKTSITWESLVVERNLFKNFFNILSIGSEYIVSFKWPDFGLMCLGRIMPKCQSPKVKGSVLFLFLKWTVIVIHILDLLIVTELCLWYSNNRHSTFGYVLFEPVRVS